MDFHQTWVILSNIPWYNSKKCLIIILYFQKLGCVYKYFCRTKCSIVLFLNDTGPVPGWVSTEFTNDRKHLITKVLLLVSCNSNVKSSWNGDIVTIFELDNSESLTKMRRREECLWCLRILRVMGRNQITNNCTM